LNFRVFAKYLNIYTKYLLQHWPLTLANIASVTLTLLCAEVWQTANDKLDLKCTYDKNLKTSQMTTNWLKFTGNHGKFTDEARFPGKCHGRVIHTVMLLILSCAVLQLNV